MDTVTFDPARRKLILYRDGVEVPEREPWIYSTREWLAKSRMYGCNSNGNSSCAPYTPDGVPKMAYKCLKIDKERRR